MKFTEAIKLNLAYPPIYRPKMPKLFAEPFDLNIEAPYMVAYNRVGYKVALNWNFLVYLEDGDKEKIEKARREIIKHMNQLVYGDLITGLLELRCLIKSGQEESAIEMVDFILKEIQE